MKKWKDGLRWKKIATGKREQQKMFEKVKNNEQDLKKKRGKEVDKRMKCRKRKIMEERGNEI